MTYISSDSDFTNLLSCAPKSDPFAVPARAVGEQISEAELAARTDASVEAVDVIIRWEDAALHVAQLKPPRDFCVGEDSADQLVDYILPARKLGLSRAALVKVADDGSAGAVIPPGAKSGRIDAGGDDWVGLELGIGQSVKLRAGYRVSYELGGFRFEISAGQAQPRLARGSKRRKGLLGIAASALAHAGLLAATAAFMPPLAMNDDVQLSQDQRYLIQHYLTSAAETEREALQPSEATDAADDGKATTDGNTDAADTSDAAPGGKQAYSPRGKVATGPRGDVPMTRGDVLNDAARFGVINLVEGLNSNLPMSDWGIPSDSLDPFFGHPDGNVWGNRVGDPNSPLDLSTTGEDSLAPHTWYALPELMTAPDDGLRRSTLRTRRGTHQSGAPVIRTTPAQSTGALPPQIIQRIVRSNFGRFRACYMSGLQQNPSLSGRVTVRFVIGNDGRVVSSSGSGDLPDAGVISCVAGAMSGLTFPAPEKGVVTVTYHITMNPSS